jgi:hypothetical protein
MRLVLEYLELPVDLTEGDIVRRQARQPTSEACKLIVEASQRFERMNVRDLTLVHGHHGELSATGTDING